MKKGAEIVLAIILLSISLVSSEYIVTTSTGETGYSVFLGEQSYFQININNTDSNIESNITQVNITLPAGLNFLSNTQTTNAFIQSFVNTSNVLSWTNNAKYLIGVGVEKYFGFAANSSDNGTYTLLVTLLNSTGIYSVNFTLDVSEINCQANWSCSSWSNCINGSQERNCSDMNFCGNESEKPLEIQNCSQVQTIQANDTICSENWICSNWSVCAQNTQVRECNDSNLCGTETQKPKIIQSCEIDESCSPTYDCSEWLPKKCKKDEIQSRTCVDLNECFSPDKKPSETRNCKANSKLFFLIIVIILITLLVIFGIVLMLILKKQKKEINTSPSITL